MIKKNSFHLRDQRLDSLLFKLLLAPLAKRYEHFSEFVTCVTEAVSLIAETLISSDSLTPPEFMFLR